MALVNDYRPTVPYTMPIQLLRGSTSTRLRDISAKAGPPVQPHHLRRELAVGDLERAT
jgi:hypothetical protein